MNEYLSENAQSKYTQTKYYCFALISHSGTLGLGHYVSYIRDKSDIWWECSDTKYNLLYIRIKQVSLAHVKDVQFYIAFYHLKYQENNYTANNILKDYYLYKYFKLNII